MPETLFNKVAGLRPKACNFIKKKSRFCEISKNTYFTEHIQTTASANTNLQNLIAVIFAMPREIFKLTIKGCCSVLENLST